MQERNVDKVIPDMGMMLCRCCGDIIFTLPTNRVKKWYSFCTKTKCQEAKQETERQ